MIKNMYIRGNKNNFVVVTEKPVCSRKGHY